MRSASFYGLPLILVLAASLACSAVSGAINLAPTPLSPPPPPPPTPTATQAAAAPDGQQPAAATATEYVLPTATTTDLSSPLCPEGSLLMVDSPKGKILQMCKDGDKSELGPLEDGGYELGPTGEWFVYCANSGACYAARLGATRLTSIGSVKDFSIIKRGAAPDYDFEFYGNNPYTVQVHDRSTAQNETLTIPFAISMPG